MPPRYTPSVWTSSVLHRIQWCNRLFQDQDQDQDLNFKTKTKTLKFFQDQDQAYSVQDQNQDFASQDQVQDQDHFVMCTRGQPKTIFFIFGRKRKWRRKWNSITAENETKAKMFIHFQPKNVNESYLIILVFFSFSYIQCLSQPYNAPPIPRPVSPFLQVVLVDGIPLSSCTVNIYLCGIFLDDISTREQFAFLVYCYRVKAIFYNLCTVLYWRLCGLTNSPHFKYPLNWGWCAWSAEGYLKQWLPTGKLLLLSHKMPWCALITAVKNYNKSLEKLQDFFSKMETKTKCSRPRPRLHDPRCRNRPTYNFYFCPRGASRPRPWSRGLHHWSYRQVLRRSEVTTRDAPPCG